MFQFRFKIIIVIVIEGVVVAWRHHPIVPGGFLFDITLRIAHNRLGKNCL